MLGSTVLIPFVCVNAMGGTPVDLAQTICTIFFVSGVITLLQTLIGDRLPIFQGGSFAYIAPLLAVAGQIKATQTFASEHDRFLFTMREVQGGIIGSGLIVMLIGATGLIQPVLRAISPITVAANIGVLGLALYAVGFPGVASCPQLGLMTMVLVILFSQYMRGVAVPLPARLGGRVRLFELFPIVLGIAISWFVAWLLTITGVYDGAAPEVQAACRTDTSSVLANSPWFRFPYPGQWGRITMSWASTLTFLAGALPAMVESLGDYFACASIVGAPVPPPPVISRAIALQGATCALAGVWGTGSGTTAYNENIGALQITRVGSRRVVQIGACFAIIMGLIGKFGGMFASLPSAMVSGLFCVMFGCICAVGLAQMRHTDQRSNRNIFILGFSLYMGLSVTYYFETQTQKHGVGPIATRSAVANNILNSLFHTAAAVALILTLLLDNTIPGSDEERGLTVWRCLAGERPDGSAKDWWEDEAMHAVYGLPFGFTRTFQRRVGRPARAWLGRVTGPLGAALAPARAAAGRAAAAAARACRCCCGRQHSLPEASLALPPANLGAAPSAAKLRSASSASGAGAGGGGGADVAIGGRNDEPQAASGIDLAAAGVEPLNPVGGNLAEDAADTKPGSTNIKDLPGDAAHMSQLAGDQGTVAGPGLGSVVGGVDARGGTDAPPLSSQRDMAKAEAEPAEGGGGAPSQQA
ncbi:NAT1 [Scenedesmus sp. PABB004]|nr:NAT1 [Scenedesmus sp. PABB004]